MNTSRIENIMIRSLEQESLPPMETEPPPSNPEGEFPEAATTHLPPQPVDSGQGHWRTWGWLALVAFSFLAGRYMGSGEGHSTAKHRLEPSSLNRLPSESAISVTVAPIGERTVERTVNAVGTLHAFEELVLSSKIEGRVERIHADLASVVQPGEVVLELDATDARLSVQQAERSLQSELAKWGFAQVPEENGDLSQLPSVVSARYRYELAKSRYERVIQLRASNSISADEFEQVKSEFQVMESEWRNQQLMAASAAATSRLRAADLEIAKQRLADCILRAPHPTILDPTGSIEYLVSERLVSEGTLLRPGTEVFRLVLGKTLKLRLAVPESHASSVAVGQTVRVFPSSTEQTLLGRVARVSPAVDRSTRTFLVEVEVSNEKGLCKPGGFAKASILVGVTERATTVPASSVYSFAGIQKIFVLEDDRVREHHVRLGEQSQEWVEIVSPALPSKAHVVTSGQRLLSEGSTVSVRFAGLEPVGEPSDATKTNPPAGDAS